MSAPVDVLARVKACWGDDSSEYAAVAELVDAARQAEEALKKAFDYVPAGQDNAACRGQLVPRLQYLRFALAKFGGAS